MASLKESNWNYGVLNDVVSKGSSNISLNKIKDDEGEYPVFGAKGYMQSVSFFQQDNDYLAIIKDGAGIGRVSEHPAKSSVLATMQYLIPKEGFELRFIKYCLESIDFSEYRTGSTIPHIYFKDYKLAPVPLPPIPEQKRIVALLDTVFADLEQTRAKTEQNLKNARELFDSYLQQVFIQKGDGWVETTLGNVAKFKNGLNFSQSSKGEELTIVGVKDFKSHFMVPFEQLNTIQIDGDLSEEYELKKNDIITVRSNGNKRLIGRCLLMGTPISKTSYSGFTIRIRLIEDNICPEFLTYYMKSSSTHELLINSGEGANISNLNQKILTALPVTYPSYEQQCELVKNIKRIETESNSLTRIYTEKLDSIDELKKSILQKAFSGELITTAN